VSISQIVREAVRKELGLTEESADEAWRRFFAAAGIGKEPDRRRDVARRHDEFLYGSRA
jgi:hypothetical protein